LHFKYMTATDFKHKIGAEKGLGLDYSDWGLLNPANH